MGWGHDGVGAMMWSGPCMDCLHKADLAIGATLPVCLKECPAHLLRFVSLKHDRRQRAPPDDIELNQLVGVILQDSVKHLTSQRKEICDAVVALLLCVISNHSVHSQRVEKHARLTKVFAMLEGATQRVAIVMNFLGDTSPEIVFLFYTFNNTTHRIGHAL